MEAIRKQLQCRSCKGPMLPPILMCQKGESVCPKCRSNHEKCPLCNKQFTNNVNEALEALANIPCFNCNKCNSPLKLVELMQHYSTCLPTNANISLKISCPIEKCTWKGCTQELPDHWRTKNLALQPYIETNICRMKLTKYSYFTNMVMAHESTFFFKSLCREDKVFWALQYLGDDDSVENYLYDIEIFNAKKVGFKLKFSNYSQSINIGNADLFKEGVCIFTPKCLLQHYLTDNEMLTYSLKVYKANVFEMEKLRKATDKLLERSIKK